MLHRKLILFLASALTVSAQQPRSFAATKFELSPELPAEEPVKISAQGDVNAEQVQKLNHKHHVTKPVNAIPTTGSVEPAAQTQTGQPQQPAQPLVPLRTLAPVQGIPQPQPVVTPAPFNPFSLATLSPAFGQPAGQPQFPFAPQPTQQQFAGPFQSVQQPSQFQVGAQPQQPGQPIGAAQGQFLPQQGQFQQFGAQPQSFQTPQPGQFQQFTGQHQGFQTPQPGQFQQFSGQPQVQQQGGPQAVGQQPQVEQPRILLSRRGERVDLWFRENYDISICKRDSRFLANEFRLKFPKNLWKNGKETLLADLLAARLEDCFSKYDSNHWKRVDDLLTGLSLAATEEEECRTGLIQEQISCDNVFSYTCQFIQKAYKFRLVPTRLIIQEARFAEDGAEKCRKIVRKIKKELQG